MLETELKIATWTAQQVRTALLVREEIALIDVGEEARFARGHPLFAAQMPLDRIAVEAPVRLPRRTAAVVVYDAGEGLVAQALSQFQALGYSNLGFLQGGLKAWSDADYELFEDVNSYSKAFGELVESQRHTPLISAEELQALLDSGADVVVADARPFSEYHTMSIPSAVNIPGAELVLRAATSAPDPKTTIVVNCAGRTRSIIGAQSLINGGLPNRVLALRNGTIGWTLAGQGLETGQTRGAREVEEGQVKEAQVRAQSAAYRAGVRWIGRAELEKLSRDRWRTLYRFDVRTREEYLKGHVPGFRHAPGGQLVQEIDMFAPVRGARIVLADDLGPRADMTASWLAQMGWDVVVLRCGPGDLAESGDGGEIPPRTAKGRYKRPYEGTDNPAAAMQAYLDWEYGLVEQLSRDGSHGFFVV